MRPFYSYCRPAAIWLGMFMIAFHAYAQDFHSGDNSMQYNNTSSPSGNSGFAGAAANLSVNLYTGGLQAALPLYTLKSSDLQIPITISYTAANGVRPSDQNTVVGMDWMLSAGGSISRIVKGLPDESDNGYVGTNNYGVTVVNGYNTPSSFLVGNFNNNRRKRVSSLPPIDGEPDIFVINTPYFTARFTLDQNGNVVFQNNTGIIVSHHLYKNSNGGVYGITVTDDQGTQYFFGTQSTSQEYTTTKFFGTSFTYISTWYLDKIVTLNSKDVVTFSYRTDNSDTIYSSLLSKNYISTFGTAGSPPPGDPSSTSSVAVRIAAISNVIFNSPKYLSTITTKLGEADFNYTDNTNSAINSSNPPELTSVVIKQFDPIQSANVTIRTFNLAYTEIETGITGWTVPFPYRDIWSDYYRRLLNSVTMTGNTPATSTPITLFNLTYYQSLPYPNKAMSQNTDYWGFMNTSAFNPDGSTADAYFFTNPDPGRWPAIYNDPPGGTVEVPTAAIFALKQVDALGGSSTIITYTPNDYYNGSYNQSAGGARVSNLAQKLPTGESYSTGYVYTDASGHSTGQLWSDLYKRVRTYFGPSCCNYNTLAFSTSPYGYADDAGVMLGYSSVKMVNPNGGYEISQFTNFSDYPDAITPPPNFAASAYNSTYGTTVSLQLSSFSYKRGLLKSHIVYKSNNDKVSEETNTYGSLDTGPVTSAIGMQDMTWYQDNTYYLESVNIYHSNIENWRLTQTIRKDYDQKTPANFLQTTSNYTYCPNKRQVRSVSAVDSKGYTSSSTFYHADDAGIPLITTAEQNALNTMITPAFNCVGIPVHQTDNRNGIIHQTHNAYTTLQYGYTTFAYLNNTDQYTGSTLVSQKLFKYDPTTFNLVSTRSTGGRVTTYQYGYHSSILVATVAGAENVYTPATNVVPLFVDLQSPNSSAGSTFTTAAAGNIILRIDGATGYTYSMNYYLSGPSTQSGTLCCQRSATTCTGSYPETVTFPSMPAGTYTLTINLASGNPPYKGIGYTYQGLQGSTTVTPGFFYEGFEEIYGSRTGNAHTGNAYYDGSGYPYYVNFAIPDSRSYLIQWWNWSKGKWLLNQQPYTGPMNISGIIDDVRVFPSDAMMTTSTFGSLIGQTGKLGMDGRAMTYEYDGLGRVNVVRDQDKNILSKTCYSYSGQPISCPAPTVYYNAAQSGSYARSNCGVDNQAGYVTYSVPANTYSSSISQADADQQAMNDVYTNGPAYANANGTCTQIYYNAAQSRSFTRNNCLAGYTAGTVTYTVAARTYSSLISQPAADALATNDINTNGQNYANTNGTCTPNAVVKYGDLSMPGSVASVTFTTAIIGNINLTPDGATGYTYSMSYYLSGPANYSGNVCAQRSSTTCSYPASATITNAPAGTYTLTIYLGSGSPPFKGMSYNYYGNP